MSLIDKIRSICTCKCKTKVYAKQGPHIGLYCSRCLKFVTWVPKTEIRKPIEQIKTLDELKQITTHEFIEL